MWGGDWHARVVVVCDTGFGVVVPCVQGYKDRRMERLRRGIGPEGISLVENVTPSEVPGLVREEMDELKA